MILLFLTGSNVGLSLYLIFNFAIRVMSILLHFQVICIVVQVQLPLREDVSTICIHVDLLILLLQSFFSKSYSLTI